MAIISGSEYDRIDISDGTNTTRHYLKDTIARNDIISLKSAINTDSGLIDVPWEQGNITSSGNQSSSKVIRSPGYYDIGYGDIIAYDIADGFTLTVVTYTSASAYVVQNAGIVGTGVFKVPGNTVAKVRFKAQRTVSTAVVPSDGSNVHLWKRAGGAIYDFANAVAKNDDMTVYWEQGNVNTSGESSSNANIRNNDYISTGMIGSIKAETDFTVYNAVIIEYDSAKTAIRSNPITDGGPRWLHPDTAFIRIKIYHADQSAITPDEGENVHFKVCSGRLQYVTPQMFGAVGNGVTDDTASFQAAVNSGYDVCVPFSKHQIYLITSMINITGPACKRIYGDGGGNGYILYDPQTGHPSDDFSGLRSRSLFRIITTQAFTFDMLNVRAEIATINGISKRVGGFLRANDDTCDYDIKVRNCNISKFYRFVEFRGRGFTVENSAITSMQILGNFSWSDAIDTNHNHPANMDQRAIIFKGNRLHSIQSGGLIIKSGHAYGLVFTDNVMDVGRKYAIIAHDEAWNWTIANNTFLGYVDAVPVFEFKAGAKNLIMTGNQMISDSYFWVSTPGNPTYWLLSKGNIVGSCISSNVIKNAKDSLIYIKGLVASTICNNILTNPGHVIGTNEDGTGSGANDDDADNPYVDPDYVIDDTESEDEDSSGEQAEDGTGCIYIETTVRDSSIVGNVATYANGAGTLLRLGDNATQSNVIIAHNISQITH